jgi:hypothetical protein
VSFSDTVVFIGGESRCKKILGKLALGMDRVWESVGAKHAVQSREDTGTGFVGWVWRWSISYD